MYNKKYILEKIEEFHRPNYFYLEMKGCICYPAYFNKGERGLFLYQANDWDDTIPHRVYTTIVKSVEYTDNKIIVTTMNTRLTFTLIER